MIYTIKNTTDKNSVKDHWLVQYKMMSIASNEEKLTRKTKGIYILCDDGNFGLGSVVYVGQGVYYNRIHSHSKKISPNNEWTYGIIIDVESKLLRQVLEKLLIHVLKPKNNKSKPIISHLVLAEKITSTSNII